MRTEKDSLGSLELPDNAYYGIQTERAVQNFPVSGVRVDAAFIRAYAHLKKACAKANFELGALTDLDAGEAIVQACNEIIGGAYADQFVTDVFQAGAGTSTNMNLNEVIANRALELVGEKRGNYARISPNDQVNMSQSTNDTYPTAMRLAALILLREEFYPSLQAISDAFGSKELEFADLIKSGRTHLQDAVPITLGQEFGAWRHMMQRHSERLVAAEADLSSLGIGGTAAGSGMNAPDRYATRVVALLEEDLGRSLWPSDDLFEAMQSLAPFVHLAGALKNLALDILKISADLRLLASGPMAGFAEIELPAVQPGSSIMPGKINPSMLEMLSQVAMQVVGVESVIAIASQAGQLELNVMMPVVQYNLCFGLRIFANALRLASEKCIVGIKANPERMLQYAESSASIVTALAPELGYLKAAEVAKESLRSRKTIRQVVLEQKLMSAEDLDAALDLDSMVRPHRE